MVHGGREDILPTLEGGALRYPHLRVSNILCQTEGDQVPISPEYENKPWFPFGYIILILMHVKFYQKNVTYGIIHTFQKKTAHISKLSFFTYKAYLLCGPTR